MSQLGNRGETKKELQYKAKRKLFRLAMLQFVLFFLGFFIGGLVVMPITENTLSEVAFYSLVFATGGLTSYSLTD